MARLYDKADLQNLVIIGSHVLNPHTTSRKQKNKYWQSITLEHSPALINWSASVEMPALQPEHLSFLRRKTFFKSKMATVTQ